MPTQDGIRIYNDNNATTPQATIAGLTALDSGAHAIVLIAGGADKAIDVAPLADAIRAHCKAVVLLPGSGTDRLLPLMGDVVASVQPDLAQALMKRAVRRYRGTSYCFLRHSRHSDCL